MIANVERHLRILAGGTTPLKQETLEWATSQQGTNVEMEGSTKMMRMLALSLAVAMLSVPSSQSTEGRSEDVLRRTLSEVPSCFSDCKAIGSLFAASDGEIDRLRHMATTDTKSGEARMACMILRYLGEASKCEPIGPVPVPLSVEDYQVIDSEILSVKPRQWKASEVEKYVYALKLDGSPRAQQALDKIAAAASETEWIHRAIQTTRAADFEKRISIRKVKPAGHLRPEWLPFLSENEARFTRTRLLSLNASRTKALYEVFVDRGPLAEVYYRAVFVRTEAGWRFYSFDKLWES